MGNRCADVLLAPARASAPTHDLQGFGGQRDARRERRNAEEEEASSDSIDGEPEDQDHVFAFATELAEDELTDLDDQFREVLEDPAYWAHAFQEARLARKAVRRIEDLLPPRELNWSSDKLLPRLPVGPSITKAWEIPSWLAKRWSVRGREVIGGSELATVILAGQTEEGSHEGNVPFSTADVGLLSHKTPLQLLCERTLRLQYLVNRERQLLKEDMQETEAGKQRLVKLYGNAAIHSLEKPCTILVYVMTAMAHFQELCSFMASHDNFGLSASQLIVFPQADTPVFDLRGKVQLSAKNRIMARSGGSGGVFKAMQDYGILADMKSRNIEYVFIGPVDNLLSKIADPMMVGFCCESGADVVLKVIKRQDPYEELGVLVQVEAEEPAKQKPSNDVPLKQAACVIEHDELPWDVQKMCSSVAGRAHQLVYRYASTRQLVFTRDALDKECRRNSMRHHWVPTSATFVDWRHGGQLRIPPRSTKNAVVLETFVTDAIERAPSVGAFAVERGCEFAPMKHWEGNASVSTAIQALSRAHQKWIHDAGGCGFAGFWKSALADESASGLCELSPLVSYGGEGLEGLFAQTAQLQLPLYIPARHEVSNPGATTIAHQAQSATFLGSDSRIGALEAELQYEATKRSSKIAQGDGRPLTGGHYEEGDVNERLPATPGREEIIEVKALVEGNRLSEQKDEQDGLGKFDFSQAFVNALSEVTRLPQLVRRDELRGVGAEGNSGQAAATGRSAPVARDRS